jgi:hypothetical protein
MGFMDFLSNPSLLGYNQISDAMRAGQNNPWLKAAIERQLHPVAAPTPAAPAATPAPPAPTTAAPAPFGGMNMFGPPSAGAPAFEPAAAAAAPVPPAPVPPALSPASMGAPPPQPAATPLPQARPAEAPQAPPAAPQAAPNMPLQAAQEPGLQAFYQSLGVGSPQNSSPASGPDVISKLLDMFHKKDNA